MEKTKVLVTGGAGFIGSHVVDELIQRGHEVIVLDDLSGGFVENVNPLAKFIHGSITDTKLINQLFIQHQFIYVYHLAAYAAEGLSHFIRRFNYENNLIGSVNLINASVNHEVKCFIFTSSIAVYGEGQLPLREETVPKPEDPYGIAKLAVEIDLESSRKMFGLNYVIFRPHNVYGERQNIGDKYRNVLGIFMNQIMQGQPLTIFGDGQQTRAFTYIGDVASVIAQSAFTEQAYNQVFNIGADQPYAVNEIAKLIGKSFAITPQINHLPARKEVQHAYSDHAKVKEYFGYETRISLSEGIRRMVIWVKQVGARQSKEFANIEIEKNLPLSWRKTNA